LEGGGEFGTLKFLLVPKWISLLNCLFFKILEQEEAQRKLQKVCKTQGVDFSLQNLFRKPKLQRNVEEFSYEIFKETINEPNLPSIFSF
jgi:hypothetical protein